MESRLNSSGTSSQDLTTWQLYGKVKDLLSRLRETPENFTGRILFMSIFNDISCGTKDNEKECVANAKVVSLYAKRFGTGQWSFIGPGSEKKWYSMKEDREVLYQKAYMSPRPPPKISLRHDWTKELGSKVDRQPEGEIARQPGGEVARQAKFFQPTQPIPNPIRDRSGRPGITHDVIGAQDERKNVPFSRDQCEFFLTKNSVLQIDQGDLVSRVT